MKILIVGGSGFLGQKIICRLLKDEHDLYAAVRSMPNRRILGCKYLLVNELISESVNSTQPFEVIINTAMKRSSRDVPIVDSALRQLNFDIPLGIIRTYSNHKTLVINTSTYIQNYGGVKGRTIEEYGKNKELLSRALQEDSLNGRYRTLDVYLFTVYGPGDRSTHLVPILLTAIKKDLPVSLSGGDQLINLLHVDDALDAILSVLNSGSKGYSAYHLWEPKYITVKELVSSIEKYNGGRLQVAWGVIPYEGHEMFQPWSIPLEKFPSFVQKISLPEGLKSMQDLESL